MKKEREIKKATEGKGETVKEAIENAIAEAEQEIKQAKEEEIGEEASYYLKKVDKGMENVESQLQQIDDMETFLKNAFGDADWEDDEEEEKKE